jgi:DNA-binding NtrC family response regulator
LKILIVDDEQDIRQSLSHFIGKLGHQSITAEDGADALRKFHQNNDINLVLTDIRMPNMDGIELLRRLKYIESSPVDVIVITGHGDMENAIQSLKLGAFDYLQKPINVRELAITIARLSEYITLKKNYSGLKEEFNKKVEIETMVCRSENEQLREAYLREIGLENLYVFSDGMRQVLRQAEKYSADRSVPLLIEGESGTGKELIARYTHRFRQQKKTVPFVAINCGALTEGLMESEMFGHESGAYTGATRTGRIGKFELASGGTIFLDEIGEMPLALQVKLLRVLEEKKLYRLGGNAEIPVDIRVICATNKDLQQAIANKQFRMDLYYRINMGNIKIPPLRDRREDILPLACRFVSQSFVRKGLKFENFTAAAEKFLGAFEWPGNVRQLKNAMERLALFKNDGLIDINDLSFIREMMPTNQFINDTIPVLDQNNFLLPNDRFDIEAFNQKIIQYALTKNNGNQTLTAKYLGISRRILQGRLKKLTDCNHL